MKKEPTLEQAMERLDEIVSLLDSGGLPLEEALKLYEQGVRLVRQCEGKLQEVKLKVETLSQEAIWPKQKEEEP